MLHDGASPFGADRIDLVKLVSAKWRWTGGRTECSSGIFHVIALFGKPKVYLGAVEL